MRTKALIDIVLVVALQVFIDTNRIDFDICYIVWSSAFKWSAMALMLNKESCYVTPAEQFLANRGIHLVYGSSAC